VPRRRLTELRYLPEGEWFGLTEIVAPALPNPEVRTQN
jgi:hypothetical protein